MCSCEYRLSQRTKRDSRKWKYGALTEVANARKIAQTVLEVLDQDAVNLDLLDLQKKYSIGAAASKYLNVLSAN